MARAAVLFTITSVVALVVSVSGNIVATLISESWKPYLWLTWPIFIVFSLLSIVIGVHELYYQRKQSQLKANQTTSSHRKIIQRVRVFGLPVITYEEIEEERIYRVFGIPVWSISSQALSISATSLCGLTLGLTIGSGIVALSTSHLEGTQHLPHLPPTLQIIAEEASLAPQPTERIPMPTTIPLPTDVARQIATLTITPLPINTRGPLPSDGSLDTPPTTTPVPIPTPSLRTGGLGPLDHPTITPSSIFGIVLIISSVLLLVFTLVQKSKR